MYNVISFRLVEYNTGQFISNSIFHSNKMRGRAAEDLRKAGELRRSSQFSREDMMK